MSNPKAGQKLFTVMSANAQDVLIISSAAFSFLKGLLGFGTYSYFHVVVALLALVCTGLAFAIFLIEDFFDDDRKSLVYGENILLYMSAFIICILTEVADVVTTIRTVRIYKRLKDRDDVIKELINSLKKQARDFYIVGLVYAALSVGVIPIVTFAKADWGKDFFSPVDFVRQIETLLSSVVVLNAVAQALAYCIILYTTEKQVERDPKDAVMRHYFVPFILMINVASLGVSITALVKVDDPQQIGGMCYLFAINSAQAIEFIGEEARHFSWMLFELGLSRAGHVAAHGQTDLT